MHRETHELDENPGTFKSSSVQSYDHTDIQIQAEVFICVQSFRDIYSLIQNIIIF
jgi:hypothetical protein